MKILLGVFVVLLMVGCYWQLLDPPPSALYVEYPGFWSATVDTDVGDLISFGYGVQTVKLEYVDAQSIEVRVVKMSLGDYVDLGTLTARMGEVVDVASLGDPGVDLYWSR